jgi:hypothetical protein
MKVPNYGCHKNKNKNKDDLTINSEEVFRKFVDTF